MYNLEDYFDDGHISRMKVASDIKSRKLTKEDLEKMITEPEVKSVFIGNRFNNTVKKEEWTKEYLEKLSNMAIGESFNKEYLFYLDEVAQYVNSKKNSNIVLVIVLVVATLVAVGKAVYDFKEFLI